jgi:hypothetical protein
MVGTRSPSRLGITYMIYILEMANAAVSSQHWRAEVATVNL